MRFFFVFMVFKFYYLSTASLPPSTLFPRDLESRKPLETKSLQNVIFIYLWFSSIWDPSCSTCLESQFLSSHPYEIAKVSWPLLFAVLWSPSHEMANALKGKIGGGCLVYSSLFHFPLGSWLPWPGYLGCIFKKLTFFFCILPSI